MIYEKVCRDPKNQVNKGATKHRKYKGGIILLANFIPINLILKKYEGWRTKMLGSLEAP